VAIDAGTANQEVRRIGTLSLFTPALTPYEDYPIGSVIEHVTAADDTRAVTAAASTTIVTLNDVTWLEPGMQLGFARVAAPNARPIQAINTVTKQVTLLAPLGAVPAVATVVTVQPRATTAAAKAGAMTIALNARIGLGLDPANPDVLRIGVAPNHELVTVTLL